MVKYKIILCFRCCYR